MVEYAELKSFIANLFNRGDTERDADIVVRSSNWRDPLFARSEDSEKEITITDTELRELYDKVVALDSENLELYSEKSYEILTRTDYSRIRFGHSPITADDSTNKIHYTLGRPSLQYFIFLIMRIIEAQGERKNRIPMGMRRHVDFILRRLRDYDGEMTFHDILSRCIGDVSLQIQTEDRMSLQRLRNYNISFSFEFMYRSGQSLVEYTDIEDVFHINRPARERVVSRHLDTPPLHWYTNEVIDYYRLALASGDPYIKYISFYHIMEYFYDEAFKRNMVDSLRKKITHPAFSYKNDDKVFDLVKIVKKRLRIDSEYGLGDEQESLKYVLEEFVPLEELRERISDLDANALQYYQTTKVPFCNGPIIPWNDKEDGVYSCIAKRIYTTRNSLIHSKSGMDKQRYKPYKNEKELQAEIPLAQAIAEFIILNSSKMM